MKKKPISNGFVTTITAQEGYKLGRKRGWCVCANCGMGLSFRDKSIIKSHIDGTDCVRSKKLFGLKKDQVFNPIPTKKED